jgi:hypothetical protein
MENTVIELAELRIGNLLLYKGELVRVTLLSCDIDDEYEDQICFVKFGTSTNEKGGWNRSTANDLKRIPLTPEWLERCGFKKEGNEIDQRTGKTIEGKWRHDAYLEWPGLLYLPNHELKHLHELQNLYFALTGEELTIKQTV